MSLVVVGHRRATALLQRQSRLAAVERLDLGLLIETEHHGMGRRCNIQAHDVVQLFDKGGVLRQLEGAPAMGLGPFAAQMRCTVATPSPTASPSPEPSSGSPRAVAAPASAGPPRRSCRQGSAPCPAVGSCRAAGPRYPPRQTVPASAKRLSSTCQRRPQWPAYRGHPQSAG